MKSFIGKRASWHSTPNNPYVTYAIGVKEEGEAIPTWCNSPELCWNGFMNELITNIENNKDKNIIWRAFPQIDKEEFTAYPGSAYEQKVNLYKITARYCFE